MVQSGVPSLRYPRSIQDQTTFICLPHSPPARAAAAPATIRSGMSPISAQALYIACRSGDAAAVSSLLPAGGTGLNLSGPAFQLPAPGHSTPLIVAAAFGHTDIVRMLLELARNTDVNYLATPGFSAMLGAAQGHHAASFRLLAEHGAVVQTDAPESAGCQRLNYRRDNLLSQSSFNFKLRLSTAAGT